MTFEKLEVRKRMEERRVRRIRENTLERIRENKRIAIKKKQEQKQEAKEVMKQRINVSLLSKKEEAKKSLVNNSEIEHNPLISSVLHEYLAEENKEKREVTLRHTKKKIVRRVKKDKESSYLSNMKYRAKKISTEDGTISSEALKILIEAQGYKCFYCGCKLLIGEKNAVHLDHHVPLSKGGTHSIDNVKYTCRDCNLKKSARLPDSLLLI